MTKEELDELEKIRKALEINPRSVRLNIDYAYALDNIERYDESDAYFEKALQLDPESPAHHPIRRFILTRKEISEMGEFIKKHVHSDRFILKSWPGPIGSSSFIVCDECREKNNITDLDAF